MMKYLAAFLIAIAVSGCESRYQKMGFTGGVTAQPVVTDVYRIVARGNPRTSASKVQDFVLMKAAEITIDAGGNYFLILDESDQTEIAAWRSGTMIANVYKPGRDTMIRVLRLRPNENPPPSAFPAHEIIETIGPRLKD